MKKRFRFYAFVLLTLLFAMLAACSSAMEKSESSEDMALSESKEMTGEANGLQNEASKQDTETQVPVTNRKLIKTAHLDVETTKFDESITKLEQSVTQFNGYIESTNITGTSVREAYDESRRASYTIRIPAKDLDAYVSKFGDIGNVLSKTISTDDVTDTYFDTEARLKSLKVQEERLLELLKNTGTLKDIIELEKELSSVRYEIESLTTTLKKYDSLIDYSTIHISLTEVDTVTDTTNPRTIGERIAHTFKQNLTAISNATQSFIVFLIGNSPLLIIWGGILGGGWFMVRRVLRKQKDKNDNISG